MKRLSVKEYVTQHKGTKVIEKILIANNGIAAVKGIRSMRRWAHETLGNASALKFVVMATPEDIKANAEYVRLADEIVQVPGEGNSNNYANVKLIVDIADRTNADAVWPGWGHASENPELPDTLSKRNKVFIGPSAKPMRLLGDKISSTIIAQSAGVPCMPWSGDNTRLTKLITDPSYDEEIEKLCEDACVHTFEEALAASEKVSFPLMIKASEGGGGKGIRKVETKEGLKMAFEQVSKEVAGSPIFLMKLAKRSRHLEVQVIGDEHGEAIALYSRDCSVQRRHQKIIEEGPVTVVKEEAILRQMEQAAIRLAKSVGYSCAGTVEYLYEIDTGKFYFLELNPRIQVEHPVTEWITGCNIPALQLQVAMGIPLQCIPDIRRFFGQANEEEGTEMFDLSTTKSIPPLGHCIAARITAENPEEGFQPTSGNVEELTFRNNPQVWGYFSIRSQGQIHSFSDSQFGHIFAFGRNREKAIKSLIMALNEISIRGDIRTTAEYLTQLLEKSDFNTNHYTTEWLDGIIANKLTIAKKLNKFTIILCAACHTMHERVKQNRDKWLWFIERGQHPPEDLLSVRFDNMELIYENTKYMLNGTVSGNNKYTFSKGDTYMEAEVQELRDNSLLIITPHNREGHISFAHMEPSGQMRVSIDGQICVFTKEFDPSEIRANTSGKLVRYLVKEGSHIKANTPFCEMEMMKMIITVYCPNSGVISFRVMEGSTIGQGDVIATLDLDDKSSIKRALVFDGQYPLTSDELLFSSSHNNTLFHASKKEIMNMLQGYEYPDSILLEKKLSSSIQGLALDSPQLFFVHELVDKFSVIRNTLPKDLVRECQSLFQQYYYSTSTVDEAMIMSQIQSILNKYDPITSSVLHNLVQQYHLGYRQFALECLSEFIKYYLDVERIFDGKSNDVLLEMRLNNKDDLKRIYEVAFSHERIRIKNKVMIALLKQVEKLKLLKEFLPLLNELNALFSKEYSDVVLIAKRMLHRSKIPSIQKMQREMEKILVTAVQQNHHHDASLFVLKELIERSNYGYDIIMSFFTHADEQIRTLALQVYLRKVYITFDVTILEQQSQEGMIKWKFMDRHTNEYESNSHMTNRNDAIVGSISSASLRFEDTSEEYVGHGTLAMYHSLNQMEQSLKELILQQTEGGNVLQIVLHWNSMNQHSEDLHYFNDVSVIPSDQEFIVILQSILDKHAQLMEEMDLRRVTIAIVLPPGNFPYYYTFRQSLSYMEDPIYRHIEPTLAFQLFLRKLSNYHIEPYPLVNNPSIHIYYAEKKKQKKQSKEDSKYDYLNKRFFVRTLVMAPGEEEMQISEAERYFVESLNALELSMADPKFEPTYANHIFVNVLTEMIVETEEITSLLSRFQNLYASRLWKLRVMEVEIKVMIKSSKEDVPIPCRFIATNKTGYNLTVDIYQEVKDPLSGRVRYSTLITKNQSPLHGVDVNAPYPTLKNVSSKRRIAHNYDTSYVYDYPYLFERSLRQIWKEYANANQLDIKKVMEVNQGMIEVVELRYNEQTDVLEPFLIHPIASTPTSPLPKNTNAVDFSTLPTAPFDPDQEEANLGIGTNRVGIVVWRIKMKTPEYRQGREVIVIANDITFQSGSFGPMEDLVFFKASELARKEAIPRIYIAANSGARIGLAEELRDVFKVAWNDAQDVSKGFGYLYISEKDYESVKDSVIVEPVHVPQTNEKRYKILDIIGRQHGLGVENLQGSGLIAGETSRAYQEIFTISYVASRTVGIGAYLVRLGQRVIQNKKPPILLTGAPALNKVLGREVYTSNNQLGGIQIMYPNGVTHLVAQDDLKAIRQILDWLSYIPKKKNAPLPIYQCIADPVDRVIDFEPELNKQYDVRNLIQGNSKSSGLFDKNSFMESLGGWAKNVVVGRARLGGIPVGVIAVDINTYEQVIPADPADTTTTERIICKAGQVWFPDSAYKTAQAIQDFNNGEELPLFILANWRGFSGGQRDMFEEVLKFGSYIVDALVNYKRPVFVYIPPFAELRGGAWVVVDSAINSNMMEMYADTRARGGVLEKSGTVEIKYRTQDILKTIHRCDAKIIELSKKLGSSSVSEEEKKQIELDIKQREKQLIPVYHNIAETFCDLHDTPGRMKKKEVIHEVVEWKYARTYFYWRLKRRLAEFQMILNHETSDRPYLEKVNQLRQYVAQKDKVDLTNDKQVCEWMEQNQTYLEEQLKVSQLQKIYQSTINHCKMDTDVVAKALIDYLNTQVDDQQRIRLANQMIKSANALLLKPLNKKL